MKTFVLFISIVSFLNLSGQNLHLEKLENKNFIGVFFGNTGLYQSNFQLPTVGIEYLHKVSPHFAAGLMTELEIGYHIIENKGGKNEISWYHRESSLLILPTLYYNVFEDFILFGGCGIEFEHNENLLITKLGIEYKLHLKQPNWYVIPSVSWDHTYLYDGGVYGITFGYGF